MACQVSGRARAARLIVVYALAGIMVTTSLMVGAPPANASESPPPSTDDGASGTQPPTLEPGADRNPVIESPPPSTDGGASETQPPGSEPVSDPDPTVAAYPCPQLSGISGDSSSIYYTFTWINDGCPTPIRKGFYSRTGFGWDHIKYRRDVDGLQNHQVSDYARNLWAQALLTPGKAAGAHEMCHQKKYETPGGTRRTMKVWHSSTNYQGDKGRKGIITAYWISGHVDACKDPL